MLLALALTLAAETTALAGRVAILTEPLVFEPDLARELCPDSKQLLTLRLGARDATAADVFGQLGAPGTIVDLDASSVRPGDDPALAARVTESRCIVLEGGTWLDWWHALRPYGKQSELGRALVAAHQNGANVIGIGPAGAHLAGQCVLSRATLQRPSRDPHAEALDMVLGGLGLARGACIDFATDGRVDPERMLEAAFAANVDLSVWLTGPCAWIQDEITHTATVIGAGAAFVFDARPARRSRDVLEGVRTVRLRAGGTLDLNRRSAGSASGQPVETAADSTPATFFAAPNAENSWISRKVVTVRGEGHVLRFVFDAPPDTDPSRPAIGGLECARLDWLPLRRQRPRRRGGSRSRFPSHDVLARALALRGVGLADARRRSW